jgi:hypothetical protein
MSMTDLTADLNEMSNDIEIKYLSSIIPLRESYLNILYLNAQSARNKFDEITALIYDSSKRLASEVHAIVITETWFFDSEVMCFDINGYRAYHCNRNNRRGG